jgi:hypothetical protein
MIRLFRGNSSRAKPRGIYKKPTVMTSKTSIISQIVASKELAIRRRLRAKKAVLSAMLAPKAAPNCSFTESKTGANRTLSDPIGLASRQLLPDYQRIVP